MEITTEPREKGNAGELVLPKVAIDIINALPKFESNPYVFAGRSCTHFSDYSNAKRRFDAEIEDVEPWTIHDLRRTARSLMSWASVRSDIAERVLGHVIPGVEGFYDRHQYREEKAHALRALASLIANLPVPGQT